MPMTPCSFQARRPLVGPTRIGHDVCAVVMLLHFAAMGATAAAGPFVVVYAAVAGVGATAAAAAPFAVVYAAVVFASVHFARLAA